MNYEESEVIRCIEEAYDELTMLERSIADFFTNNKRNMNFSSKNVSKLLYVSEASLSRFAKKCGYKGYREFIYDYERYFEDKSKRGDINQLTSKVLNTYQSLLKKNLNLVNESQMIRIAELLTEIRVVFVYGMGSSGIAAQEFQLRFMRLGLYVQAITDSHMIKMRSSLANEETLVIAISLSGKTEEILSGIHMAREHGAKVIMITSNTDESIKECCDEVLNVAVMKDLDMGIMISPQFPILIMIDIFYTYYLNNDFHLKKAKLNRTLSALRKQL